ncbi:MAG: phosphoribosylformylglycinamidine cyclo-ligase [Gemmatimonadota bacterium]
MSEQGGEAEMDVDTAAGPGGGAGGEGGRGAGGTGAGLTYRDAGVDREAAERAKKGISEMVRQTYGPGVLSRPGSFGGLFRVPSDYEKPVLAASADGVGTKLKVAMRAGRHGTVGHDLVNHCVDDILVEGAKPLFFLDYIGMGELEERTVEQLVAGVARGCHENGCALLGGETAEMPDLYSPGEYDLAGFIVGMVEEEGRLGASRVRDGDTLVALASDGFHTNGYTLLRRVLFDRLELDVDDPFPELEDRTVGEVLLRVHRSYLRSVHPLLRERRIAALAHVTGGGIPDNLARVLPDGLEARVDRSTWTPPAEFRAVMDHGGVPEDDMWRTFNMGVGMIAVVRDEHVDDVVARLRAGGEDAWVVGAVGSGDGGVVLT